MNFATESKRTRIFVWAIWLIIIIVSLGMPGIVKDDSYFPPVAGVILHEEEKGALFPWQPRHRWRKWAWRRYQAARQAYRRARQVAWLARLAMKGMIPMAQVVDLLVHHQVRYKMGALPVLYALLETLDVRTIINRYCPTQAEVDIGTVAFVLILNRLMFPLPLYRLADWVGQTVLVAVLDVPAAKFNDDRLGRALDAMAPHLEAIWLEVVRTALKKTNIDRSVVYYDLSAFIAHGRYADSELMDFGFAHNTPSNKRKFKLGLDTLADGNIPWLYRLWSGRTADQATVQENMQNLKSWLQHDSSDVQTLIVGDRAMLNAEIALDYDDIEGLLFLGGLRCIQKKHKELLIAWDDEQFLPFPIVSGESPRYWGRGCTVTFSHEGRTAEHRGLVVVSGPLRDQLRETRQKRLDALEQELIQVRESIGQARLRTIKALQRRVNARLRASKVEKFMDADVYETSTGHVNLAWRLNETRLAKAERLDGRYLLVTNDWSLSHREMFQLYRDKDGGEKRFLISKQDLKVSPVYLHQDQRISSMLFINMLALLAYSILERQVRQQGLSLTTRQIIQRLENLTLIETHCHDGSRLHRLPPPSHECLVILQLVAAALDDMVQTLVPEKETPPCLTSTTATLPQLC